MGDPASIIAKGVGGLVARPAFDALKDCWKYVNEYDSNMDEVQKLHKSLKHLKDETIDKVVRGEENNQIVVPAVKEWMEDVEKIMDPKQEELKDLFLEKEARRKAEQCCFGSCWNPKYRYTQSKKAEKQVNIFKEKIQELRERGTDPITVDSPRPELRSTSSSFLKGLKSREKQLSEIMDKLKEDDVNKIGIHGMGGSGKTTLVQELARRCEEENMFDVIVIAEISEVPDFKRIQDEIADRIGFSTLERYHSIEERAMNLSKRLMQIRKGQRSYNKSDQHDEKEVEKLGGTKSERKYLNKDTTIHYLEKNDKSEIIEENGDIEGLEKRKCSNEDIKQEGTKKNGKLLVVLDNMWQNLDLHLLGIPRELEKDLGCKIIMTSRNEDVCKEVGAQNLCIFKVGDLNPDEAFQLFREKVGEIADTKSYKNIIPKLLEKCTRLPLSITLMANTLKNQPLSIWEQVLKQLENPIEEEIQGVFGQTYSVIEMSYKLLGNKEKKMFFLLCCIFPPGSMVNVMDLLRYGIGLDLFQHVDYIVEALDQACRWVNDLKSLSLLLEVDVKKGVITIHDDVRKAGKSFAGKGVYAFHVGDIPRWMKRYSYKKFKGISMTTNHSYKQLDGRTLPELQLLRSLNVDSSKLNQSYFKGMINLKVLDMSDSNIENFPSSFGELTKLEILILERCSLKELSEIWKLVELLVLSFKESNITYLPENMRALTELKLLDLTNCNQLKEIPFGIFIHLKQLEGLYMKRSFSDWATTSENRASLAELACLPLKVLEIDIQNISQLPDGDFPVLGVIRYNIGVAMSSPPPFEQDEIISSQDLQFGRVHACDLVKEGWKHLMNKAKSLHLNKIEDLENISPYLGIYWSDLKRIAVSECDGLQHLINPKDALQLEVFSKLETLRLEGLIFLKAIYHGNFPDGLFSSLQELILSGLGELHTCDIEIGITTRLRVLEVQNCKKLVSIFSASPAVQSQGRGQENGSCEIRFTFLKKMILSNLPAFEGLFPKTNAGDTNQFLFSTQVTFPCLDKMKLETLGQIEQLWDIARTGKEFVTTFPELRSISLNNLDSITYLWRTSNELHEESFSSGKLKKLKIRDCDSMKIVFPLSVSTCLQELELLRIYSCYMITQVISSDEGNGKHSKHTVSFSKLQILDLLFLPKLTYFYKGVMRIEFPCLKVLKVRRLSSVKTLVRSEICSGTKVVVESNKNKTPDDPIEALFSGTGLKKGRLSADSVLFNADIEFISLEELVIVDMPELEIDDVAAYSSIFPRLIKLYLIGVNEIKVKPLLEATLHMLKVLYIGGFKKLMYIVSSKSDTISSGGALVKSLSELENLEELTIEDCNSIKGLFKVDEHPQDNNVTLQLSSLRTLWLSGLENLESVQWHMVPNIQTLFVNGCPPAASRGEETFLIPTTSVAKGLSLQSLESMTIQNSNLIDTIIGGKMELEDDDYGIVFPRLREVKLKQMGRLCMFSSTEGGNSTIRLPSLESIEFKDCGILTTFSSGPAETPKLSSLKVNNKLLISTTSGDPNTAVQSEFDSEYKFTKHWRARRWTNVESHDHSILLSNCRTGELCHGCGKEIIKYSYSCSPCKFDLHPVCAMERFKYAIPQCLPKTLMHRSDEHVLEIVAGRDYTCNKCHQTGLNLSSYTCDICEFALHTKCALDESQLKVIPDEMKVREDYWPKIVSHESHVHKLTLMAGRHYGCDNCGQTGELFSYSCELCNFDLHPKCALEGSSGERRLEDITTED